MTPGFRTRFAFGFVEAGVAHLSRVALRTEWELSEAMQLRAMIVAAIKTAQTSPKRE
jgi:hypothetical protein